MSICPCSLWACAPSERARSVQCSSGIVREETYTHTSTEYITKWREAILMPILRLDCTGSFNVIYTIFFHEFVQDKLESSN